MSATFATCAEVEAALFAALETLAVRAAPPGPFVSVVRAGRVESVDDIRAVTTGKWPACVLSFDRSTPEGNDGVFEQSGGHLIEVVERLHFVVHVAVANPTTPADSVVGRVGAPGVLALAQQVKEATVGLSIPGLFDGDVVHLQSHTIFASRVDSILVHQVNLTARVELPPSAAGSAPGAPFVTDVRVQTEHIDPVTRTTISTGRAPR